MESTNKKRTAVVAAATAAALVLSGTFAWNMATDQTKLNEFSESDKGNYGVELKENFDPNDPWANKDVYVTNTEDNPVIVRVRLEEFYDLTYRNGTEYNKPEGYANRDADGSAIFTPDAGDTLNDDKTADSATKLNEKISLLFGAGVVTMAEYNAMDANAKAAVKWVVDTDGWCYYTQALLAGETTEYLLDKATFNKDVFDAAYDSPYNLDYRINVRLQAISADLEDFGSHLNDMQWTNVAYIDDNGVEHSDNKGRVIAEDNRADNYEITADSTITDEAMALVTGIAYGFATPYTTEDFRNADGSVAVTVSTAQELIDAVNNDDVHSILLTNNIDTTEAFVINSNKFIDLGEYTLKSTAAADLLFTVYNGAKMSIKHGNIISNDTSIYGTMGGEATSLELVGVNISGAQHFTSLYFENTFQPGSRIAIYGSNIETSAESFVVVIDTNYKIINSKITSQTSSALAPYGDGATDVNMEFDGSYIKSMGDDDYGLYPKTDWVVNAKNTTFDGVYGAICENHNFPPKSVILENCTLKSNNVGYYKAAGSPLTMKDCNIDVVSENDEAGLGIFVRSGDVTLDNVKVTVDMGESGYQYVDPDSDVEDFYNHDFGLGHAFVNYDAISVVLNSYENINLNIIGGSYKTNVEGAKSVYVNDHGNSLYNRIHPDSGVYTEYDYENVITISGNPTFTPATTAFDTDYANTTIIKND